MWLADQRYGRFAKIILGRRFQALATVFGTYSIIIFITITALYGESYGQGIALFLGKYFTAFGFEPQSIQLDIASIVVCGYVAYKFLMPRVMKWISHSMGILPFITRSVIAFIVIFLSQMVIGFIVMLLVTLPVALLLGWTGVDIEKALSISEAISSLAVTPLAITQTIVMGLVILSLYWLCIVTLLMVTMKIAQFVIYRIIENNKGIVLGASGLLVGIGAIVSAMK